MCSSDLIHENLPHLLADLRAAGLEDTQNIMAERRKMPGQQLALGGFAGTFGAFECDEEVQEKGKPRRRKEREGNLKNLCVLRVFAVCSIL